ncbi:isoprenoid synthase domain-containing protein [Rhodofomes roseus]|uniref:Isoprenoid synthase domain-containing protein n=1 Tax=Rhodofomes roseus TaxID=34475 RepID=A0ABQ8KRY4_9APHY|nr:isoprenoid synthase domain-containing protein [Rhodofomes roseus]KAH9841568.1 isoprenoid synthase domain-containing protein [Rhodofomes roseus]
MLRPTFRRLLNSPSTKALFRGDALAVHRRYMATNAEEGGIQDPATYCSDLVRKRDYESFLISQFWPRDLREHFIALRAFYVELASVQESVSNITLGKMRMQFWRDALKGIADGRPPRHPIALALGRACQAANLQTYHLKRIVDARDAELDTPAHMTLDSLTSHAESTSSTFLYLQLSLLSLSASSTLSHAASHLGVAQGITTLLRALPYHASQGRMVIPAEITARHGVSQEEVFRKGGQAKGIEDAVFEFATVANDNLQTSLEMLKTEVPGRARPVFLNAVPTRLYLERLEAANFDAFNPSLHGRGWQLPWRIWSSYYRGRF